jgi:multiple sugar transport system permease protein
MDNQVRLNTRAIPAAPRSSAKRAEKILGRDWKVALPFILPTVIIMAGLILFPFINAIAMSTTSLNLLTGETMHVGFKNYERLFSNSDYIMAMRNTIQFTFWSLLIKFLTGMIIALILNSRLPMRHVLTGLMLLPWIVPEIVTALAWKSIYDPVFGALNPILLGLGILQEPQGWLSDPRLAMQSVIVVNVWKGIPFYTILLLAGLKAVDRELLEAAEVDGANVIKRFRHVTLPSMRYVIVVTLLLSFISTFNTFGLILLMTNGANGATRVYSILAYEKAVGSLQRGPGAAIALSVAPLMAFLIWMLAKFMRRDEGRGTLVRKVNFGDRVLTFGGKILGIVLDLFLLPFELLLRVSDAVMTALGKSFSKPGTQPTLNRQQRDRASMILRILILLPILFFVLFPFYWVIITSFKTTPQISQKISLFWPNPWTLDQYQALLLDSPFLVWFRNTVFVALSSTVISVSLASLGAYALARLKFLGAGALTTVLLITYLLPGTLLFIPMYQILTDLGIINTHLALITTYPAFMLPFATWVMIGYFRSIPVELEEAAMIDGASRLRAFWRITLPLAAPALLSVTLFAFTGAWNEFLFAFVFITSESLRTLPIGLQSMIVGDILPWGRLMAASLLMAIPVVIFYTYAQRFLVEGLTLGSVKG